MHEGHISVELRDGSSDTVPYGTAIWATGIAMHPLVARLQVGGGAWRYAEGCGPQGVLKAAVMKASSLTPGHLRACMARRTMACPHSHLLVRGCRLQARLPAEIQTSRRGLLVDPHLRVLGSRGSIFCLGDAAVTGRPPLAALPPTAQVGQALGLVGGCSGVRFQRAEPRKSCVLWLMHSAVHALTSAGLGGAAQCWTCLACRPRRQVARQEGEYLAALLCKNRLALWEVPDPASDGDLVPLPPRAKPFRSAPSKRKPPAEPALPCTVKAGEASCGCSQHANAHSIGCPLGDAVASLHAQPVVLPALQRSSPLHARPAQPCLVPRPP